MRHRFWTDALLDASPARPPQRRAGPALVAWIRGRRAWIVLALTMTAFALGLTGFLIEPTTRSRAVLYSLQLFLFAERLYDVDLPWPVEVARYLAPIATAVAGSFAALAAVRPAWDAWRAKSMRAHVVVVDPGDVGLALAERLLADGSDVLVALPSARADSARGLAVLGARVIHGDPRDETILDRCAISRAAVVLAVSDDDVANAAVMARARRAVDLPSRRLRGLKSTLHGFADLRHPDLRENVRAITAPPDDPFELRMFSSPEIAARVLWVDGLSWALPRRRGIDEPAHLVLVGLGIVGEEILLAAARNPHRDSLPGLDPEGRGSLHVTVVDRDATKRLEALRARRPGLDRVATVRAVDLDVTVTAQLSTVVTDVDRHDAVSTVVLALPDGRLDVAAAFDVARALGHHVPVFVRTDSAPGLDVLVNDLCSIAGAAAGAAAAKPLVLPFGAVEDLSVRGLRVEAAHERMARAAHRAYLRHEGKAPLPETPSPSTLPWATLAEAFRGSNRDQVDHIVTKLVVAGWRVAAGKGDVMPAASADLRERLSVIEHARWCAERWLAGWTYAPPPKDAARKTSPFLVPWGDLPPDVQQKDRDVVDDLPEVLAAAGLRLVPSPRGEEAGGSSA